MSNQGQTKIAVPPELAQAKAHIDAGDYAAAEAILAGIVDKGNAPSQVHMLRSRSLRMIGRGEDAVREARSAVEGDPANIVARTEFARALLATDRHEEAKHLLADICGSAAATSAHWSMLGDALIGVGSPSEAVDAFEHALRLEPDSRQVAVKNARAHALYSRALLRAARTDEALHEARAAVNAATDRSVGMPELARALLKTDQAAEARDLLLQASATASDDADIWALLSEAHRALGENDAAHAALDRAIVLEPDSAAHALKRSALLAGDGRLEEAEQCLMPVIARMPEHLPAQMQTYAIRAKLGRWTEAAATAEKICALAPDSLAHRCRWAEALLKANKFAEAVAATEQTDADRTADTDLALRLGFVRARAHQFLGNDKEAVDAYAEILARQPDFAPALERMAIHYEEQGQKDKARTLLLRLQGRRQQELPETLEAGLARLSEQASPAREPTPAMRWAWGLADQKKWTWEEWCKTLEWGARARRLLVNWWKWNPSRRHEIAELVKDFDKDAVRRQLTNPRGCFLASGHVGIPLAIGAVVGTLGAPLKILGTAGIDGAADNDRFIPVTTNMYKSVRSMVEHLGAGGVLATACDLPIGETHATDFLGVEAKLPAFVPRLVREHAGASFYVQALWENDRLAFEIRALPAPVADESDAEWMQRWFGAFLGFLEPVFRGDPRNLSLGVGIPENLVAGSRALGAIARHGRRGVQSP